MRSCFRLARGMPDGEELPLFLRSRRTLAGGGESHVARRPPARKMRGMSVRRAKSLKFAGEYSIILLQVVCGGNMSKSRSVRRSVCKRTKSGSRNVNDVLCEASKRAKNEPLSVCSCRAVRRVYGKEPFGKKSRFACRVRANESARGKRASGARGCSETVAEE